MKEMVSSLRERSLTGTYQVAYEIINNVQLGCILMNDNMKINFYE